VTLALGGELLALSGLARDAAEGAMLMRRTLDSGAAAERFERMVAALGGPGDFLTRASSTLPSADVLVDAAPERRGVVAAIEVRAIGLAVVELGGGRARVTDAIDHAVGFTDLARLGAEVGPNAPLARVHARSEDAAEAAAARLRAAYLLAEAAPERRDPIIARIGG
jgi:thymidine phosphorylase